MKRATVMALAVCAAAMCQTSGPQLIRTGIFLLPGSGGNVIMRLSYKGPVLVDASRYGDAAALRKLAFRIADQAPALSLATEARSAAGVPKPADSRLEIGGIEVQALRFDPEKCGIETAFYFPDLKVLAIGALLDSHGPGMADALSKILKLDFELVVPGRGNLLKRADLQALLEGNR